MGDMSREPSMEEILSSIKRIIAEDGEQSDRPRSPRRVRAARPALDPEILPEIRDEADDVDNGILELTDEAEPVISRRAADARVTPEPEAVEYEPVIARQSDRPSTARESVAAPAASAKKSTPAAEGSPMLSAESEIATRQALASLSNLVVKPQGGGDDTLEGLVRSLLRPMLKEWLDANLPDIVQEMVAKEIARISAG